MRGDRLFLGEAEVSLPDIGRIEVVGAGKAVGGMAAGLEDALGTELMDRTRLEGWVNVPANTVRPLQHIHLHPARPPGKNEPTEEAVRGTQEILKRVTELAANDLCLCLLSGGGSALLPSPAKGLTLEDKLSVTRWLSAAGADIYQLNTVRKQLSDVKGGRLARACHSRRLVSLIISDVLGDSLDIIASGPTVADTSTPSEALEVLAQFDPQLSQTPSRVIRYLRDRVKSASEQIPSPQTATMTEVTNIILGNNLTAVEAAAHEARHRGYVTEILPTDVQQATAEEEARELVAYTRNKHVSPGRYCWISGGEPTVRLISKEQRGSGGRNQQLVLAALAEIISIPSNPPAPATNPLQGWAFLSGGTDGEDGPTDAAGAFIGEELYDSWKRSSLVPETYLAHNNAYHFFEPLGGLLKTGPTDTNVCDVRVVLCDSTEVAG